MTKNYDEFLKDLLDSYSDWFNDDEKLRDGRMTAKLYPYNELFSPVRINRIKVKNRIVMGPMGNISLAEETGRPNGKMVQYFTQRAKGGTGLLTSGLIPVGYGIDPSLYELDKLSYFPRIDRSRTVFAGWRDLIQSVHSYGSSFFIQLTPGLGRVGSPECLVKKFKFPVSSYWNSNFYMPMVPCRPLSGREVSKIVKAMGQAGADAKACHADGVYLHGHEGYLLEQFANTAFNRRKFGKYKNWQRFGIELVSEIRKRCGKSYPIMYRIDLSLALRATYGKRMNSVKKLVKFKNERSVELTLDYLKNLVKAGVDIVDIDLGCYENWWLPHPPAPMPPGCFLPVAKIVKDFFKENGITSNAGLPVPVVAVGKLGYPDLAEKALREQMCDMIMLARPLLADPYWPRKAYAGKVKKIVPCIGEQEACINEFIHGGHPKCAVNPETGFEDVYKNIVPVIDPKKVAVVGAGPAGVVCSTLASKRGHNVTLYDKQDKAGGVVIAGSVPKSKFDVTNYVDYLNEACNKCSKDYGLSLNFGTIVSPDVLKQENYDVVICCTGARQAKPPIAGIKLDHVKDGIEILNNPSLADKVNKIVIIGGGSVGCEIAHFLAYEKNKTDITVVEMLPYFMKDVCTANRGHLIHYMEKKGIRLFNCSSVESIEKDRVNIIRNISKTVPDPYVTWNPVLPDNIPNPLEKKIKDENKKEELEADIVIIATGLISDDRLYEECVQKHVAPEIHNIGDAFQVGLIFEATKAGYAVGASL